MLRVGYVPEHFSSPLLQLAAENPSTITLVSCPSGTGQMTAALNDNSIDVAIALTESLIASIANRKDNSDSTSAGFKLIGKYVTTPLNWAVITGSKSSYKSIDDIATSKSPIGISRIGSGSHVMASYMAFKHKWENKNIDYKICDSFENLRNSVNDGSASCFLWEWYTTKPFADSGEVRFIGSMPTPWPSWLIAANPSSKTNPHHTKELSEFLNQLSTYVNKFNSEESRKGPNVEFIKKNFGYNEDDIVAWLKTVGYPDDVATIESNLILDTLE